jgi:hypothetical protein
MSENNRFTEIDSVIETQHRLCYLFQAHDVPSYQHGLPNDD